MHFCQVDVSKEPLVNNLLNLYMHDMSEWFGVAPDQRGHFGYIVNDHFETNKPVYLAFDGDRPAGFSLITTGAESTYEIEEFFLIRHYRHRGIAEQFASHLWNQHPGEWIIRVLEGNLPAVPFWRKAVSSFIDSYRETQETVEGSRWICLHFNNMPSVS